MSEGIREAGDYDPSTHAAGAEFVRYEFPPVRADDDVASQRLASEIGGLAVARAMENHGTPQGVWHEQATDATEVATLKEQGTKRVVSGAAPVADDEMANLRVLESRPPRPADRRDGLSGDISLRAHPPRPTSADDTRPESHDTPVAGHIIADRTTSNRIDLADDVHAIALKPTYDGYLDLVMHGDHTGTQADVRGDRIDFTLSQTAAMIESSPAWDHRPIRLLSCNTGQETYAQELADRLEVPVYAPNGILEVSKDGHTTIEDPDNGTDGRWRRFEPHRCERR